MAYKTAVLAIHGMGDTQEDYAQPLQKKLAKKIGSDWSKVYFDSIYYGDIFQKSQTETFLKIKAANDIDWVGLRKFLLFGFSDAAGFERIQV